MMTNNKISQLTEVGVSTEIGQSVLLNVEEELKPEPGHVTTLLQLMVVKIVLGKVLRLSPVIIILVQVKLEPFVNFLDTMKIPLKSVV